MNISKKILAITLALLMLLSLSACGMSDLPIIKAGLSFMQLNSFHVRPEGEVGLAINIPAYGMNMDISITADGDIDYCADPLCIGGEIRLNAMDQDVDLLIYGEDRGGDFYFSYSEDKGVTWTEKELGKTQEITAKLDQFSDLSLSDLLELGKTMGDAFGGFSKAGQETVNGQSATRYDASFSLGKVMSDQASQEAFFSGMASSLPLDADTLAQLIDPSQLEDIVISLWLDGSSRIVKAEIDMTAMMHSFIGTGLLDTLLASEAGLEGIDFSADVTAMRVALVLSNFDGVGMISRPTGLSGSDSRPAASDSGAPTASLTPGSSWLGTIVISNYSGQGSLGNGEYDVWALLDTAGGQTYFEIYDAEDAWNTEASPVMSFWARVDGNRIVPEIDPAAEDAWLIGIYLDDADEDDLVFTLSGNVLSASYHYVASREACDLLFTLTPET